MDLIFELVMHHGGLYGSDLAATASLSTQIQRKFAEVMRAHILKTDLISAKFAGQRPHGISDELVRGPRGGFRRAYYYYGVLVKSRVACRVGKQCGCIATFSYHTPDGHAVPVHHIIHKFIPPIPDCDKLDEIDISETMSAFRTDTQIGVVRHLGDIFALDWKYAPTRPPGTYALLYNFKSNSEDEMFMLDISTHWSLGRI